MKTLLSTLQDNGNSKIKLSYLNIYCVNQYFYVVFHGIILFKLQIPEIIHCFTQRQMAGPARPLSSNKV